RFLVERLVEWRLFVFWLLVVLRFLVLRFLVARGRARHGWRRWCRAGPARAAERIGLADQPREFGERIVFARAMLIAATIVIVSGERSALISISHRYDASPTGKSPHNSCNANRFGTDEPPQPMRAASLAHFVGSVDA